MDIIELAKIRKMVGGSGGGGTGGGDSGEEWIGDGKTHLWIKIAAEGRMDVPLYFQQTVANGVTIDWGDGSATETLSGTGKVNTTHTYAKIGEYIITLDVADGCTLVLGGSNGYSVMGSYGNNGRVYTNMLQKVEIGNGVTSIGNFAFYACYSLVNVTIPESVTSIGDSVFGSCYSIVSVKIPESVTSIGSSMFSNCYSLVNVTIPESVTSIGGGAFNYCYSLASVKIPESVTSIGSSMFSNCYSLVNVTIPESLTSIKDSVFSKCYSIVSVKIPESVTSIGSSVFYECYSLANVTVPESVTSIGQGAFHSCCGMKFYDFTKHTAVPTLGNTNAFNSIPSDCEIRVPAALYDEWISATNWSTYASNIVAV